MITAKKIGKTKVFVALQNMDGTFKTCSFQVTVFKPPVKK
jgi:hypothetical protein